MLGRLLASMAFVCLMIGCNGMETRVNPLLDDFRTPFEAPPFDQIEVEHFLPAMEKGIELQRSEVEAIAAGPDQASFENTVESLEHSGAVLRRVSSIFFNLNSALTNEGMQAVAKQVAPLLSKHSDDILMNAELFARVKQVYDSRASLALSPEQQTLLRETYEDFVRSGAQLPEADKTVLRQINERLSVLTVQFGENVLKETNAFELLIEDPADLAGLPEGVVAEAAEAAKRKGHDGKWLFTLHKPSLIPFLQYSERRPLRAEMLTAYVKRGDNGNGQDNNAIAHEIASLRARRARLLGYESHAAFVLEKAMAKTPAQVSAFLDKLWVPALDLAKKEASELQALIQTEGGDFKLEPWDWWYYAEKIRKEKFDLDDELLRPFLKLDNVLAGAFEVANRLYGITFEERTDLPKYHEDVRSFEVREADGTHIGILYVDYFPRESKRAGAWMNLYRKQSGAGTDAPVAPIVSNVCNFSKPTADRPALLTLEEVGTLFHEFGHALHGLFSQCRYYSLSGTSVPRDFVELPSQIMENWATHPDVMKSYAKHWETGEIIPDELIAKVQAARRFNQGFTTVEYLAASFLDMDWHTWSEPVQTSTTALENASMEHLGMPPEIFVRYRSTYFNHIFSGGYASGYYSYIWAEVLDADAFKAFEEKGLFDQATARSFRDNILSRGGSEEGMDLYKRFRGAEPTIDALLKRRGLD